MNHALAIIAISVSIALAQSAKDGSKASGQAVSLLGCGDASDDRALRKIAEQWRDGYNRGDAPAVAALYTEDAYYLTQHFATGIVHGRGEIQAYVQRGVDARYHIDSIQVLSTNCSADFAYTVGRYDSSNGGQKAFGVNLVVLRRVAGQWLIVAHESAVPDPATAIQKLDLAPPR